MHNYQLIQKCLLLLLLVLSSTPSWSHEEGHQINNAVYHLDDSSNARWAMMLANSALEQNSSAKIVIVAHGPGIDFLIKGAKDSRGNSYAQPVKTLIANGGEIYICEATLNARDIPKKNIISQVQFVPSGAHYIVQLQNKFGYAYLKP